MNETEPVKESQSGEGILPHHDIRRDQPSPDPHEPRPGTTWDRDRLQTPAHVIEELRSILIVDGNLTKFQKRLDELMSANEGEFRIHDLGIPVMFEAIKRDSLPFIMELLSRGIRMNSSFVKVAVTSGAQQALNLFLWNGWDINKPETEMDPPVLGYAAMYNEGSTLWLLDRGADPNRRCHIDTTPLSWAAQWGTVRTIKVMLDDYDGDVHTGQLLHYAVRRKVESVEVLELLLDRGARINQTMYENHDWSRRFHFWMPLGTALHEAARVDNVRAARYLLSRGIDASIKDTKDRTALECARKCKSERVVKLLEEIENNTPNNCNSDDNPSANNGDEQQVPTQASSYCSTM